MTDEFFALMERFVRLGSLLPPDDVDHIDPAAVPAIKMILAEMNETMARLDGVMAEYARTQPSEHVVRSTQKVKKPS